MKFRKVVGVLAGAALLVGGFAAAAPAQADTATYQSWIEKEDLAPLNTTEGLVFYQNASINYGHIEGSAYTSLGKFMDLSGLAYTVAESSGYAPSYQIGIMNPRKHITYARLVWEPYMQSPSAGDKTGAYTALENGLWWGNRVFVDGKGSSPFGDGAGSQSHPQQLAEFIDFFGYDAQIAFFGVKQGSSSGITSTVTSLTFLGKKVALGNPDTTQYSAKDLSDATTPLQTALDKARADLTKANTDLTKANTDLATAKHVNDNLQSQLDAAKAALTQSEKDALAKLVAAQNEARTLQAKLVTISGTAKVGKTVTAKFGTSLSAVMAPTYQWYVGGKAVKGATKASLKLAKADAGKSLSVKVTTKWTDDLGKANTVAVTVKYLVNGTIAK
jgi:hypothetical protein